MTVPARWPLAALLVLASAGCGLARWPVDAPITSPYGLRLRGIAPGIHRGVDLAAPDGTPVKAMASGRVRFAGAQRGYGNVVWLDHGGSVLTVYAHLSEIRVETGAAVRGGDVIGDHTVSFFGDGERIEGDGRALRPVTRPAGQLHVALDEAAGRHVDRDLHRLVGLFIRRTLPEYPARRGQPDKCYDYQQPKRQSPFFHKCLSIKEVFRLQSTVFSLQNMPSPQWIPAFAGMMLLLSFIRLYSFPYLLSTFYSLLYFHAKVTSTLFTPGSSSTRSENWIVSSLPSIFAVEISRGKQTISRSGV